jgi:hypothetical protein
MKENAMFVARLVSNARPIAVLLGGSGIAQANAPRKDVGALLSKPDDRDATGWMAAASGDSLCEIGPHD